MTNLPSGFPSLAAQAAFQAGQAQERRRKLMDWARDTTSFRALYVTLARDASRAYRKSMKLMRDCAKAGV